MRFVAGMSIQMILGESASLIAAVGFIQLYNFMYNSTHASNLGYITQFTIRVSIAISIDFVFTSFSFWLQMSYLRANVRKYRESQISSKNSHFG